MKILLVLAGLIAAAGAGALGARLCPCSSQPTPPPVVGPAHPTPPPAPGVPEAVRERMTELEMMVADLELQIADLRSTRARESIAPAAVAVPAASNASAAPVPEVQREAILQVIADQKAAEERARDEARAAREKEQQLARADRMAQRFGLNEYQESQLAEFYSIERTKFDDMRKQFEEGGYQNVDREQMRASFQEAQAWREGELVRMFGDVGTQIAEHEMDRFRRGGFGGGGDGGGGDAANAGPQGARRARAVAERPAAGGG